MELSINNISKSYNKGKKIALENFSLKLTSGIYGLLGPNGAGKSTLLNIITDNLLPDCGRITYNSTDINELGWKYRNILGYMPQQQSLYDDFTGYRFLWYMAALKGLKRHYAQQRIEMLLNIVGLSSEANRRLSGYSGGMKQRILIVQALLNDPEILILDEPTAGLDPKERIRIRNFISAIALNKIVIIATHVVSDIEFIAKKVILMNKGKLLFADEPVNVLSVMENKVFEAIIEQDELPQIQEKYKVSNIIGFDNKLCVRIVGEHLSQELLANTVRPNLEDLYLHLFE